MTMPNPFDALGLPADPGLSDEQVRAAWRAIAAATHPDRADGGDPARYARASAAYAELRTPWGRGEAYADAEGPGTEPLPVIPGEPPAPGRAAGAAGRLPAWLPARLPAWLPAWLPARLLARIRHGRPLRLLLRACATALLSLAVLALIPGQPAEPAVITGLIVWFVLTGRADLAPPPVSPRTSR